MWFEQAIFARTLGGHANHYGLVAHSSGIEPSDAAALQIWGPAHDCLVDTRGTASSLNFFPLPSGSLCLARSRPQPSGLGTESVEVVTHCLLTTTADLERLHNDPFQTLRAIESLAWLPNGSLSARLPQLNLHIETQIIDDALIARAISSVGVEWLVSAVGMFLHHSAIAVAGDESREALIGGLVQCLPPACRAEFAFSTGLKYSPRRPFRLFAVGSSSAERQRLERQGDVVLLDLHAEPPRGHDASPGWSGWVRETLLAGDLSALRQGMSDLPRNVRLAHLDTWGESLLEQAREARFVALPLPLDEPAAKPSRQRSKRITRQDGPKKAAAAIVLLDDPDLAPSMHLSQECPAAAEILEMLDDLVFEAVCGRRNALAEVTRTWSEVLRQVGPELIEETRAQYVRHVMHVWRHCVDGDTIRNPDVSLAVTSLIELMLGGR